MVKYCEIGGQGVLEGVMMRSKEISALAVRKSTGEIVTSKWPVSHRKNGFLQWPVVRGCVNLIDMMTQGVKVITDSAKMFDEEAKTDQPSKLDKAVAKKTGKSEMDVMMGFAVVLSLALSIGLFFLLPSFLVGLFSKYIESNILINLIEGGIRILILVGYMLFCSCVKDVRRVFMYHGAEHKTISCYESGEPLTVENVRTKKRLHPRCGTSFLLLVMIIAILIYSVFAQIFISFGLPDINSNLLFRVLSRLILLPLIAGVSYEVLKGASRHENWFTRAIRWPGLQLQRLTTKEPDDSMLEVAIIAFEMALAEKSREELAALADSFDRREIKPDKTAVQECGEQDISADNTPAGQDENAQPDARETASQPAESEETTGEEAE